MYSISVGWLDHILKQLISLKIFLPFIPLFVAFNALGILPVFVSLTSKGSLDLRMKLSQEMTSSALREERDSQVIISGNVRNLGVH